MIDLFQRNFDTDARPAQKAEAAAVAEAEAEAELNQQLEAARQQGFDAGRRIGRQDAEEDLQVKAVERHEAILAEIQAQIAALAATDARHSLEMERDIVELFSGIAERLVPELLDTYGIDLALSRIRTSIEHARTDPVLKIRACPDVIGVLQHESPQWLSPASGEAQITLQPDADMNPGAVQVHWQGGQLEYDLHAASQAMMQALAHAAEEYENETQRAG